MRLAQTLEARQQQTQRIDPRQILASEILAWNTQELEAAIERELAENPALEIKEGESLQRDGEAYVRESPAPAPTLPLTGERPQRDDLPVAAVAAPAGEEIDPFDRVAHSLSLRDHLRQQVGQVSAADNAVREDILRYLIENVDERGYLIADLAETAERFRTVRARVEAAVEALQSMDPPGIGARDLRECLRLQAEYLELNGEGNALATRIIHHCWDELVAHRQERIVSRLKASPDAVDTALNFLRRALTPYPGANFRPAGNREASAAPPVRPDIVFHRTEAGYVVELARDFEQALLVAPLWKRLADTDGTRDEAMRRYVRDHVDRAQSFLTGVSRRGRTLRAIARELARHQVGFLETRNRAFLKPLTRQTIAEKLKLDESVISRAVADKWAQLPTGEIIPLDAFFGNSQAVREALLHLIANEDPGNPYSDDEIAELLTDQGFPLARRTVAKYRGLERILPARLRRRRAA